MTDDSNSITRRGFLAVAGTAALMPAVSFAQGQALAAADDSMTAPTVSMHTMFKRLTGMTPATYRKEREPRPGRDELRE